MGKYINLEFLIPILRHVSNLTIRNFTVDWLAPACLAMLLAYLLPLPEEVPESFDSLKEIANVIVNAVAVLIGFTLAILAILVSGSSKNLEKIKDTPSDNKVGGKAISIFQEMINSFTFVVIAEFFVLVASVVTIAICNAKGCFDIISLIYGLNLFFIFSLASINVRNATNLYLVFWTDGELNQQNELTDKQN